MRVRAPIVVRPATTTWLLSSTPFASVTVLPIWQYGPIRTSSPRAAPSSMTAVGCTLGCDIFLIQDHGADFGLGHDLPVDLGLAVEAPRASAAANLPHMVVQLIAREHGLAELGAVYPHEIHELRLVAGAQVMHAQRAGRLCQAFDDEHSRHHRKAREVTLEERFVDGDRLDADRAFVTTHVDNPI